jgi:hypothetical protein
LSVQNRSVFLEKQSYRRRRARDASRLLPILAIFLFFVPGLWAMGSPERIITTSQAWIFLFCAWTFIIVVAVYLSRLLSAPVINDTGNEESASSS